MFPTVLCLYLGQFTVTRAELDSQLYQLSANPSDAHMNEEGGCTDRKVGVMKTHAHTHQLIKGEFE